MVIKKYFWSLLPHHIIGQALHPPLTLRQKGLVPATAALRAFATSTSMSYAQQTFPPGYPPVVKDCFGLHRTCAYGSVANKRIGVGQPAVVPLCSTILTSPTLSIGCKETHSLAVGGDMRQFAAGGSGSGEVRMATIHLITYLLAEAVESIESLRVAAATSQHLDSAANSHLIDGIVRQDAAHVIPRHSHSISV